MFIIKGSRATNKGSAVLSNPSQVELVIIGGVAGAGKDTQARLLSIRCGWPVLVVSDALRATKDPEVLEYIRNGLLVPKGKFKGALKESLGNILVGQPDTIIINGILRSLENVEVLLELMRQFNLRLKAVVWLYVDPKIVIRRLQNRYICPKCKRIYNLETAPPRDDLKCDFDNTPLVKREDDSQKERILRRIETIQKSYPVLKDTMQKIGPWYEVNANEPIERIHQDILKKLQCDKIHQDKSN